MAALDTERYLEGQAINDWSKSYPKTLLAIE